MKKFLFFQSFIIIAKETAQFDCWAYKLFQGKIFLNFEVTFSAKTHFFLCTNLHPLPKYDLNINQYCTEPNSTCQTKSKGLPIAWPWPATAADTELDSTRYQVFDMWLIKPAKFAKLRAKNQSKLGQKWSRQRMLPQTATTITRTITTATTTMI